MASIFSALGSCFNVITDSCEAMSSGISNFREQQKLDHKLDEIKRKSTFVKEFHKAYGDIQKSVVTVSDEELGEINKVFESLNLSQIIKSKPTNNNNNNKKQQQP